MNVKQIIEKHLDEYDKHGLYCKGCFCVSPHILTRLLKYGPYVHFASCDFRNIGDCKPGYLQKDGSIGEKKGE